MRSIGAGLAVFALLAFASTASHAAEPALPADLARAVSEYDAATTSNDTATLARLVADDYVLVNSDSSVQGKESYLADFRVPGFKLDPYLLRDPVYRVWESGAVTGGLLNLSWIQDGQRRVRLLRIAHVWRKRDGRWQLAYTQLTRVPD